MWCMAGDCKLWYFYKTLNCFVYSLCCLFDPLNWQIVHNFISSAGASSPAVPNVGSIDGSSHGQASKAASLSCVGSQPPWTSLSTSAGGSAFGSSRSSCRPWERGDLLRRLATFIPSNWLGKPQVWTDHGFL